MIKKLKTQKWECSDFVNKTLVSVFIYEKTNVTPEWNDFANAELLHGIDSVLFSHVGEAVTKEFHN